MCIAIYKPANKIIDMETLQRCFSANPDGAGFMYSNGTEMKIHKGFFSFKSFWKAFQHHQERQCLIHFRIKTHGEVSVGNCHPFFVTKDIGFIHNGIISKHGGNRDKSDTRDFNETILRPLVKQFGTTIITSPQFDALVSDYIGFSKLAFLDIEGNVTIVNDQMGVWDDEVWYSNSSYKPVTPYVYQGRTTYYSKSEPKAPVVTKHYSTYDDMGTYAILTRNFGGIIAGEEVEIISWGQYHTVDVETLEGFVVRNIPVSLLEFDDDPTTPAKPVVEQKQIAQASDYYGGNNIWDYSDY